MTTLTTVLYKNMKLLSAAMYNYFRSVKTAKMLTVWTMTSCCVASGMQWIICLRVPIQIWTRLITSPNDFSLKTTTNSAPNRYQSTLTSPAEDGKKCWRSKVAVVDTLLLHSCTVACILHCIIIFTLLCKHILLHVIMLFTNKLAPSYKVSEIYQVSMWFRNLLTNHIAWFLTVIL